MEYCNFKLNVYSRNVLHQIACFISVYDTWDLKTRLSGKQIFNDYNLLFSAYGNDEFVKSMLSKIADYRSNEWNDFDKRLLAIEKKKRAEHVRRIATNIRFGFWDIPYNNSSDYKKVLDFLDRFEKDANLKFSSDKQFWVDFLAGNIDVDKIVKEYSGD